jgi:hypothetical protein
MFSYASSITLHLHCSVQVPVRPFLYFKCLYSFKINFKIFSFIKFLFLSKGRYFGALYLLFPLFAACFFSVSGVRCDLSCAFVASPAQCILLLYVFQRLNEPRIQTKSKPRTMEKASIVLRN